MTARHRKNKSGGNRLGVFAIGFVVMLLLCVLSVQTVQLKATEEKYQARQAVLQQELENEKTRTTNLDEYRVYVQTKEYIESAARQRLGLVSPGEILIKPVK